MQVNLNVIEVWIFIAGQIAPAITGEITAKIALPGFCSADCASYCTFRWNFQLFLMTGLQELYLNIITLQNEKKIIVLISDFFSKLT